MGGFRVELMDDKGGFEAFVPADIISWIQSGFDNFFNDARGDVDHLRNPTIPPRSKARPPTIFIVSVLCICKIWASGQRICTIYPLN
jgi:hypothetical protein